MSKQITYSDSKFKELLLHIADKSVNDPRFGKTKLNKILYFVDFVSYTNLGQPVTGATYQRRPNGPVPKEITAARAELVASGDAAVESKDYMGYKQERLLAKRAADLNVFIPAELEIIEAVIVEMWDHTATSVSDKSHMEPGWRLAAEKEDIPYCSAFIGTREMTSADIERGQQIWAEISQPVPA